MSNAQRLFSAYLPAWEQLNSSDGFVGKLKTTSFLCVSVFVPKVLDYDHTYCNRCCGKQGVLVCNPIAYMKMSRHSVTVTVSGNTIKFRPSWATVA